MSARKPKSGKPTPTAAAIAFREELKAIMPGYAWRIEKPRSAGYLEAWGTQSSGSNRLSTLYVLRKETDNPDDLCYEAKSAGYGTKARWLHTNRAGTLARALRGLQDHYEAQAQTYKMAVAYMQEGRPPKPRLGNVFDHRDELIKTLEKVLKHFTKTPSTLADTTVRGDAHAVIKRIREAS